MICKKILITLSAFVLCGSTLCRVNALEYGTVKYDDALLDYSKFSKSEFSKTADFYFKQALKTKDSEQKKQLLQVASGQYFILSNLDKNDLHPLVQLGRIYDEENQNNYAKAYFFRALEIDKNDSATNYYLGEFYYTRHDYKRALNYYNIAFKNGFTQDYDILLKLAGIYEKLGDLQKANQYYKKAFIIKHSDADVADKIRELEDIKYKNTGYYNKKRKTESK